MKILLLFLLVCNALLGYSQVSAGADNATPQGQITWNIGELITEEMANAQGSTASILTITEIITATETTRETTAVQVFPNPVVDRVNIRFLETFTYTMLDNNGKVVAHGKDSDIDMQAYTNGVYLLQITNSETTISSTYKIVKQ